MAVVWGTEKLALVAPALYSLNLYNKLQRFCIAAVVLHRGTIID
jgi:hypothetical protein